jgi:hypothetical protein
MENENPKIELGAEKKFEYGSSEVELDVKNRAIARHIQKSFHDLTMLIGTCNIPIKLSMELLFDREGFEKYM